MYNKLFVSHTTCVQNCAAPEVFTHSNMPVMPIQCITYLQSASNLLLYFFEDINYIYFPCCISSGHRQSFSEMNPNKEKCTWGAACCWTFVHQWCSATLFRDIPKTIIIICLFFLHFQPFHLAFTLCVSHVLTPDPLFSDLPAACIIHLKLMSVVECGDEANE